MLQKKKIIINHCALRRYFAVDFMFFVYSVLSFLLKFISTHYHIQKQREKIEGNPTEKMNCNRYNKITYAEFFFHEYLTFHLQKNAVIVESVLLRASIPLIHTSAVDLLSNIITRYVIICHSLGSIFTVLLPIR